MEFPRLVYKASDEYLLVESSGDFDKAIKAGWFESVPAAMSGVSALPPSREELEEKAAELGIGVHHRMKDETILSKINDFVERRIR